MDDRIALNKSNLFGKAYTYYTQQKETFFEEPYFAEIIAAMLNTKKYMLSATVMMNNQGQMRAVAAETFWGVIMGKKASVSDVEAMLYIPEWNSRQVIINLTGLKSFLHCSLLSLPLRSCTDLHECCLAPCVRSVISSTARRFASSGRPRRSTLTTTSCRSRPPRSPQAPAPPASPRRTSPPGRRAPMTTTTTIRRTSPATSASRTVRCRWGEKRATWHVDRFPNGTGALGPPAVVIRPK